MLMPTAPLKPCRWPGCPGLTAGRFCPQHQAAEYRRQDQRRGNAASRGYGAGHRRWRIIVLAGNPLCASWPRGVHGEHVVPATIADHITPLAEGGSWEIENGQGLCASCHARKSLEEMRRRGTNRGG